MASTIKSKTLRVTIQEDIVLDGVNYGSKKKLNIPSINEIFKRIVTCPANSETTLAHFHSSVADGTLAPGCRRR